MKVAPFMTFNSDDEEEEEDNDTTLLQLENHHDLDWNNIQQTILDGRQEQDSSSSEDSDSASSVEDFVSGKDEYQILVLEKKLAVFRKQLILSKEKNLKLKQKKSNTVRKLKDLQQIYELQSVELEKTREELSRSSSKPAAGFRFTNNNNRDTTIEWQKQRQEAMRQLMSGATDQLEDDGTIITPSNAVDVTLKKFKMYLARLYPLSRDLKQIEAYHGSSVVSYFRFFRWMIVIYLSLSIPCLIFLIRHVLALNQAGKAWKGFKGIAPHLILFQSYQTTEAVEYTVQIGSFGIIMLLITLQKWIREDRMLKTVDALESGSGKKNKFSRISINAWDFFIKSAPQALDLKKSIAEQIRVALHEDEAQEKQKERSTKERYILYFRRFLGTVLYLSLQASGWFVIILLTTQSATFEETLATYSDILAPYAASIVPAGVTIINAALPALISAITKLEKWDDAGFAIKAMVTRLFIAKIMNVMIQLFSYALLLDPYFFATDLNFFGLTSFEIRQSVEKKFQTNQYDCRAEQASLGLITLVMTEFVISKVLAVFLPILKKLWARIRRKPFVKSEFIVAPNMVGLLYFQTLLLMAIPLSPSTILSSCIMMLMNFKFQKLILMWVQRKPVTPWSAKDSGNFFIKFYFVTVLIYIVFMHTFLLNTHLPKTCALQDDLGDQYASLCIPNTFDLSTQLCTVNASHPMTTYMALDCQGQYPKCICAGTKACGPFLSFKSGYDALNQYLGTINWLNVIYILMTQSVMAMWILFLAVTVLFFFRRNTLNVVRFVSSEQSEEFMNEIETLRKKIAAQERKLVVHQKWTSN